MLPLRIQILPNRKKISIHSFIFKPLVSVRVMQGLGVCPKQARAMGRWYTLYRMPGNVIVFREISTAT